MLPVFACDDVDFYEDDDEDTDTTSFSSSSPFPKIVSGRI
jgi:hypothetical protein